MGMPRPLTEAERAVLGLLLSVEFDGVAELRQQGDEPACEILLFLEAGCLSYLELVCYSDFAPSGHPHTAQAVMPNRGSSPHSGPRQRSAVPGAGPR